MNHEPIRRDLHGFKNAYHSLVGRGNQANIQSPQRSTPIRNAHVELAVVSRLASRSSPLEADFDVGTNGDAIEKEPHVIPLLKQSELSPLCPECRFSLSKEEQRSHIAFTCAGCLCVQKP